jgi:hypothetical protein
MECGPGERLTFGDEGENSDYTDTGWCRKLEEIEKVQKK